MFRVALVTFVCVAFVAGLGAAYPAGTGKPQLRVVTLRPLAVAGTGFRDGETVRVSARTDAGTGTRTDEAGTAGRIDVRFPKLKLRRCPTYVISARGDEGSLAAVRSVPRPCGIDR